MFNIIIVMLKSTTCIVRRVNVNTFYLPSEILFESAEREKIVTMNEHIARPRFPIGESAGFGLPKTIFRDIKEQTRLNGKWFILFAYPRQFQFIYLVLSHSESKIGA